MYCSHNISAWISNSEVGIGTTWVVRDFSCVLMYASENQIVQKFSPKRPIDNIVNQNTCIARKIQFQRDSISSKNLPKCKIKSIDQFFVSILINLPSWLKVLDNLVLNFGSASDHLIRKVYMYHLIIKYLYTGMGVRRGGQGRAMALP